MQHNSFLWNVHIAVGGIAHYELSYKPGEEEEGAQDHNRGSGLKAYLVGKAETGTLCDALHYEPEYSDIKTIKLQERKYFSVEPFVCSYGKDVFDVA